MGSLILKKETKIRTGGLTNRLPEVKGHEIPLCS